MTNHGDYSPEARDGGRSGKARAAGVFAEHAEVIVAALPDVPDGHVLVAVVDAAHAFGGTHHVAQDEIVARVPELEGSGWAMVFTPGTDADVRRRPTRWPRAAGPRDRHPTRSLSRRERGARRGRA